jgi:hypothetical protein
MMKIAEAMPEEKFDYKPTAAQRTYGEQIMHVAVFCCCQSLRKSERYVAPSAAVDPGSVQPLMLMPRTIVSANGPGFRICTT